MTNPDRGITHADTVALAGQAVAAFERLRAECCECESCGHIQAEPNWCHECGRRTRWPEWAQRWDRLLTATLDRENDALARYDLLVADLRRVLAERGELNAS